MNRAFNRLVNVTTRVSLNDTQCGFKAFRAPAAKLLFHCSVTERFAFDVEILSLARRLGFTIAEVPVQWLRVKGSQIRPWTDARSMAGDVVRAGRGAAWAAPIPTLGVKLPSDLMHGPDGSVSRRSLRKALAPWLPVVDGHDGELLVLCPQMSEPQIGTTAAWISAHFAGAALERSALTVAQLCEMAPLLLTSGDEPGALEGDEVSPFPMAAKRAGS